MVKRICDIFLRIFFVILCLSWVTEQEEGVRAEISAHKFIPKPKITLAEYIGKMGPSDIREFTDKLVQADDSKKLEKMLSPKVLEYLPKSVQHFVKLARVECIGPNGFENILEQFNPIKKQIIGEGLNPLLPERSGAFNIILRQQEMELNQDCEQAFLLLFGAYLLGSNSSQFGSKKANFGKLQAHYDAIIGRFKKNFEHIFDKYNVELPETYEKMLESSFLDRMVEIIEMQAN